MKALARFLLALGLALALLPGCDHDHDHEDHGDDHDDGHGHGHGHGGEDDELPARAVTEWTDKSELFMEYAPFVVGSESEFLAHVTVLEGFEPLREGNVSVTLAMKGGESVTVTAEGPARPGIFIPAITPERAGECSLTVEVRADSLVDRIDAGPCRVFSDHAEAKGALAGEEEGGGGISFLKEQQWVIDFATAAARPRELQRGVRVNAEIRAVPDREARLTAATAGRLVFAKPVPILGQAVKKGQLLASIQPTATASSNYGALKAAVDSAEAQLGAAVSQRDRLARLVAEQAVPRRRLDDAEAAVKVARAQLSATKTRLASYRASASGTSTAAAGAFRIRSPLDGTLVDVRVTSGETVNAGDLLFAVIQLDRVWIAGRVFEADLPRLKDAGAAWFQVEGHDEPFEISDDTGRLVTIGSVIDPKTRTVPIVFEVTNPDRVLRIGQFATLTVATGEPTRALAVPESALLQDGGQWVLYVQPGGESFERRVVQTGLRSRGWVEVQSGLSAGEHVVTAGAYDVKLAGSASGAPAHGHSH